MMDDRLTETQGIYLGRVGTMGYCPATESELAQPLFLYSTMRSSCSTREK